MNTQTNNNPSTLNPQPSTALLAPEDIASLGVTLDEMRGGWSQIKDLPDTVIRLDDQLQQLRRSALTNTAVRSPRSLGSVSDECAREFAARVILHCVKSDMIEALCSVPSERDLLIGFARSTLNISIRTALSTTEIPLPAQYGREIRELISDFGVVRRRMSPYPIGMGTARPARMGTRPAFGSIAMSAAIPEKSPTFTFASLESHKVGGIVRLPREIDEQSIVSMGQFLARYGAVEFARAEDTWGFLADGSGTYEAVKGIVQIARESGTAVALPPPKPTQRRHPRRLPRPPPRRQQSRPQRPPLRLLPRHHLGNPPPQLQHRRRAQRLLRVAPTAPPSWTATPSSGPTSWSPTAPPPPPTNPSPSSAPSPSGGSASTVPRASTPPTTSGSPTTSSPSASSKKSTSTTPPTTPPPGDFKIREAVDFLNKLARPSIRCAWQAHSRTSGNTCNGDCFPC